MRLVLQNKPEKLLQQIKRKNPAAIYFIDILAGWRAVGCFIGSANYVVKKKGLERSYKVSVVNSCGKQN